jgi:hypothetical protein
MLEVLQGGMDDVIKLGFDSENDLLHVDAGRILKQKGVAAAHDVIDEDAFNDYNVCPKHKRMDVEEEAFALDFAEATPSSNSLLDDWVIVEDIDESRLVPHMADDDTHSLGSIAKIGALGGAAGLLLFGPAAGVVIATGTVKAYAEPGSLSATARDAVRWMRRSSPKSIDECRQAYDVLVGRARHLLGEVHRLPVKLNPSLASVCAALSGDALAERDIVIQRLQNELESSHCESVEEKVRIEKLKKIEAEWREHSMRLTAQLHDAEQVCVDEKQRHDRHLEATRSVKDKEIANLKQELQATEQIWKQDTSRLTCELEHHRRERLAENTRLSSELADAAKAREEDLSEMQKTLTALEEAQHAKAAEVEAKERAECELEVARHQRAEENELKRCCICLEAERQVLFLPCRHVCCCGPCSKALGTCPMDRMQIQQKISFIMS